MAISAQGAIITFDGVMLNEVVDYAVEINAAVQRYDQNMGTVRINALANNAVPPSKYLRVARLIIQHNGSQVLNAWAFARSVRLSAVTNDIVRYTIDFQIWWVSRS